MDEVKLIKKSEYARNMINTWRNNLVNAEIDVIFFKNKGLVINSREFQENQKSLTASVAKQRMALGILHAAEQELEICLKEEAEQEKKKN